MNGLVNKRISCPYCGEHIEIVIDCSISELEHIEDCEVCCRPINIKTKIDSPDTIHLLVRHENDC